MKNIYCIVLILCAFVSCKQNDGMSTIIDKNAYLSFGEGFSLKTVLQPNELFNSYKKLKPNDTLQLQFQGNSKAVCQKKGCWMTMALPENKEVFVKFKDYGFFVPTNSQNSDMIVSGKAFVSVESVDELKHYAKDEGKNQAEIDLITQPKTTYSFLADGVLIKK